jgi:hypothetical protein
VPVQLKLKQDSHRDGERGDDANGQPSGRDPVTSPGHHLMDQGVGLQSGADYQDPQNHADLHRAQHPNRAGTDTVNLNSYDSDEDGYESGEHVASRRHRAHGAVIGDHA